MEKRLQNYAEFAGISLQGAFAFAVLQGIPENLFGANTAQIWRKNGANTAHLPSPPRASNSVSSKELTSLEEKLSINPQKPKKPKDDFSLALILDLWQDLCPTLPKALKLTPARRAAISKRQKEKVDFAALFRLVSQSDFLSGRVSGERPFKATFDWVLKPTNLQKIIEGNFNNASPVTNIDRNYHEPFA